MEKFGIFELLDTLSALVLPDGAPPPAPESRPDAKDAAFAPPAYGTPSSAALSSFLEKHDAAVKRTDGARRDETGAPRRDDPPHNP